MRGTEERQRAWTYVGARVRGGLARRAPEGLCPQDGGRFCVGAAGESYAPRVRSGLAHVAGFLGLAVIFRPSFATLLLWHLELHGAAWLLLLFLTGFLAPASLALGFAAGAALDREPGKSGRPQAMLGFLAGLVGTINWLAELKSWAEYLGY